VHFLVYICLYFSVFLFLFYFYCCFIHNNYCLWFIIGRWLLPSGSMPLFVSIGLSIVFVIWRIKFSFCLSPANITVCVWSMDTSCRRHAQTAVISHEMSATDAWRSKMARSCGEFGRVPLLTQLIFQASIRSFARGRMHCLVISLDWISAHQLTKFWTVSLAQHLLGHHPDVHWRRAPWRPCRNTCIIDLKTWFETCNDLLATTAKAQKTPKVTSTKIYTKAIRIPHCS